jgi:hypothetical protein
MNEYNHLEEKLLNNNLSSYKKIKILERQKELLLNYLIESNKATFKLLKLKNEKIIVNIPNK